MFFNYADVFADPERLYDYMDAVFINVPTGLPCFVVDDTTTLPIE